MYIQSNTKDKLVLMWYIFDMLYWNHHCPFIAIYADAQKHKQAQFKISYLRIKKKQT